MNVGCDDGHRLAQETVGLEVLWSCALERLHRAKWSIGIGLEDTSEMVALHVYGRAKGSDCWESSHSKERCTKRCFDK